MARRIKRLKQGKGHWPWEEHEIEQFRERWKPTTVERALFEHFLDTGQRGCDVVRMSPKKYRNGQIHVAQTKTDEDVWITVLDDHKPILDPWLASHGNKDFMFPNAEGGPMSEGTMRNIMHNAIKKAGLQPPRKGMPIDRDTRSLHGLRYTFAVRAIEAHLDYDMIEAIQLNQRYRLPASWSVGR